MTYPMKFRHQKIFYLTLIIFLVGSLWLTGIISAQAVDWPALLKRAMPEADKFTQLADLSNYKSRNLTQLAFPAYQAGTQIGIIYYAAPKGYSGNIHMLTALDMNGTVLKVNIISHTETPAYVQPVNDGSYQRQFEGITLADRMAFLIGTRSAKRGEIQSITGSTETAKPIAIAVSEARKLFVEIYPR